MNKIKRVAGIAVVCVLSAMGLQAQNTYSPYSSLGLGEIYSGDYSQTAGMAGVAIGIRNGSSLNSSNPAALAALDSLSGIFEVGVYGKGTSLRTNLRTDNSFTGNINKLALGFRGNKWWSMSVGLKPFSNVGYHIQSENASDDGTYTETYYFDGDGGLYNLYAINAVKLLKDQLSVGVITSLIAGSYTQTEDRSTYYYTTSSRLTQFHSKFGLQYDGGDWVIGITYGYKQKLRVKNTFSIYNSSGTLQSSEETKNNSQFIPETFGVGASITRGAFLFAGEYEWEKWKGLSSGVSNITIGDAHKIKLGTSYTHVKDVYMAHKAIRYQAGLAVNKSYIQLYDQSAWNYAVSVGALLPLHANQTQRALLNIGLEFGSSLKAPSGYIRQNYLMLNVNFSLIETMFMRRKIY